MKSQELVFYTKPNCPLCDDARELLVELEVPKHFHVIEKDITQDDRLYEKYGLMIPVLEWQGEILQYGNFVKKDLILCLERVNSSKDG